MAVRTIGLRTSMLNLNMKKYLAKASTVGYQLELGVPTTDINGLNAILLDYVLYSMSIGNEDYEPQDKALDIVI